MSQKASLFPSVTLTLTSVVVLAVACVGLIQQEKPQSVPEQPPHTRADDRQDAGEEPTHQAPPPDYGHRIVDQDPRPSRPKPTKAQVGRGY